MHKTRPPARLRVLLARNAPYAVIIRRGPAKRVCIVGWNRRTDEFKVGQWLSGNIYEERCDLSPDGVHLIYFAANHMWESETRGTWTAISRAPYLKAISIWSKGDTYFGGGVFLDDRTAMLHGFHRATLQLSHEIDVVMDARSWGHGEWVASHEPPDGVRRVDNLDAFLDGRARRIYENAVTGKRGSYRSFVIYQRGWRLDENGEEHGRKWWMGRHVTRDWWLRRPIKGHGYELINRHDGTIAALPLDADWADTDDYGDWEKPPIEQRVLWTARGQLFAAMVGRRHLSETQMLHDFNPMEFDAVPAPY